MPLVPSMVSVILLRMVVVPTTAGRPNSRATIAQWLRMPPESATTPLTVANSGTHPDVLLSYDIGLKQQGDYFFAMDDTINKDPSVMTRFLRATKKGWSDALTDVNDGAAVTKQQVPDLDMNAAVAELSALKPLIMTDRTASAGLLSLDEQSMKDVMAVLSQAG